MGILLKVDGSQTPIDPDGSCWTIDETKRILGGWSEAIYFNNGDVMLVDSDGWPKDLPFNPSATILAAPITGGSPIAGNVLLTDLKEWGETELVARWGVSGSGNYRNNTKQK